MTGVTIRDGTATAAVHRALAAIDADAGRLGAWVHVDAAGALAAARALDERPVRGALHGVCVGVKDMIEVAGMPFERGSRLYAGAVGRRDAACISRLREAGAIIVGKTTTHELAYGPTGDRSAQGPSRNPWDPARMSGGSSGGSASAVAGGMVDLALGTDTGGSVRIPAALCGVVGAKPTHQAITSDGVFPLARSLDDVGVLGADLELTATALAVLASAAPAPEQATAPAPAPRIGWLATDAFGPVDSDVSRAVRGALAHLDVPELEAPPPSDLLVGAYAAIQSREVAALHAARMAADPELIDPEVLDRLRAAAAVDRSAGRLAARVRTRAAAAFARLLDDVDVLALPTVPITAPRIGARRVNGRPVRDLLLSLTSPFSVLGLPALSVPVGSVGGLPVGLQLVAGAGHDGDLIRAATEVRR